MIKTYPDKSLREKCKEVPHEDIQNCKELISSMEKIIIDFGALGLAANQIGATERVIGICPDPSRLPRFMVNPKITEKTGTFIGPEACLSFPGVLADIKRNSWIKVEYQDTNGDHKEEELFGKEAIVVQHEIDHLNGTTLAQRVPGALRNKLMRQLKTGKRKLTHALKRQARLDKIGEELSKFDKAAVTPEEQNKNAL